MIEICLNPDNQMLGGEVFESVDSDVHADSKDSQEMALKTAEKLLKELRPKPGQQMLSYQILEGMLQLATKLKPNIEKALQDFMNMAAQVCCTCSLTKNKKRGFTAAFCYPPCSSDSYPTIVKNGVPLK